MRKLLAIVAALSLATAARAQYNPTTTWPYVYPDFISGTAYLVGGTTVAQDYNIHLGHDALHYIDKSGVVKEASLQEVMLVVIGEDRYVNVNGGMMKVEAEGESKGLVVSETLGDFAALQETGGAYGTSSSTSATRRLSSIETDSQVNQNHMLLKQGRSDGKMLPTITKYYLVTSTRRVQATKRDVEASLSQEDKAEWKQWLKSNKVRWNKPGSLVAVVDWLASR